MYWVEAASYLHDALPLPPQMFHLPQGRYLLFPSPSPRCTQHPQLLLHGRHLPVASPGLGPETNGVLDMCAGLGGKNLAKLQTKYPERITCNDTSNERVRRIIFCPIYVALLQIALFL